MNDNSNSNLNDNSNISTNLNIKLSKLQQKELAKLLDKHENRKDYGREIKSSRRTFLHITEKNYPDYYHISDSNFRLDYNAEMEELEKHGLVELIWKRYQEGEYLEKIALCEDNIARAYAALNRKPKIEFYRELKQIFQKYQKEANSYLNEFYQDMLDKLENLENLPYQVKCDTPREMEELLTGLNRLTEEKEHEVLKRNFSVTVYGNSKRWEKYENRIVWILKNYWLDDSGDNRDHIDDTELLSEFGLIENPRHVNISGPMEFSTDQGVVDLKSFYPDVGLPPQMIKDMQICSLNADSVITIENLTSYYHYLIGAPENHLVIYLGGYHNRMRRQILNKLRDFVQAHELSTSFYHWGDIDLGGFRIYAHLKEKTEIPFQPLMMDEKTYLECLESGHEFNKDYEKKLADLLDDDKYSQFHNLISLMLKHKMRIEQEAVGKVFVPDDN